MGQDRSGFRPVSGRGPVTAGRVPRTPLESRHEAQTARVAHPRPTARAPVRELERPRPPGHPAPRKEPDAARPGGMPRGARRAVRAAVRAAETERGRGKKGWAVTPAGHAGSVRSAREPRGRKGSADAGSAPEGVRRPAERAGDPEPCGTENPDPARVQAEMERARGASGETGGADRVPGPWIREGAALLESTSSTDLPAAGPRHGIPVPKPLVGYRTSSSTGRGTRAGNVGGVARRRAQPVPPRRVTNRRARAGAE